MRRESLGRDVAPRVQAFSSAVAPRRFMDERAAALRIHHTEVQ